MWDKMAQRLFSISYKCPNGSQIFHIQRLCSVLKLDMFEYLCK